MPPVTDEIIARIYDAAHDGHVYQLHTLTKAQVIAIIDRLRTAEKLVAEFPDVLSDARSDAYSNGVNAGSDY